MVYTLPSTFSNGHRRSPLVGCVPDKHTCTHSVLPPLFAVFRLAVQAAEERAYAAAHPASGGNNSAGPHHQRLIKLERMLLRREHMSGEYLH